MVPLFSRFALALLLFSPILAHGATCGPGTTLAWDYAQPLPANVDGFRLYANGVQVWTGTGLQATPDLGETQESKTFWVTAYNDAQESGQSNSVICEYVTNAPPAVLNLRFLP
jgi:hypothetical protein